MLVMKLGCHLMMVITAICVTVCAKFSLKFSDFVSQWNTYFATHNVDPATTIRAIQRRNVIALVLIIILIVTTVGNIFHNLLQSAVTKHLQLLPFFTSVDEVPLGATILLLFVTVWSLVILSACIAWVTILSLSLRDEFQHIESDFESDCAEGSVDLESIRVRHFHLSTITNDADGMFSFTLLACLIWSLAIIIGSLYLLMITDLPPQFQMALALGAVPAIVPMFVIVFVGTKLNEKVWTQSATACQIYITVLCSYIMYITALYVTSVYQYNQKL